MSKNKERNSTNPMADITAKKLFNDTEVTIDFIDSFLGIKAESVSILNGTISDLKEERKGYFSTSVDVLAKLDDGTQVIIEIQIEKQAWFIKRLWTYMFQHFVKDLPNVRKKAKLTHEMYDRVSPVYSIAIVAEDYFDDGNPIHSFAVTEAESGDKLLLPFGKNKDIKEPFRMTILELSKFKSSKLNKRQRLWFEFFANKDFSEELTEAVKTAEKLLDRSKWSKEEQEMFTSWQHRMVAHFDELEARERKGFSEGARQNALEVARKMIADGLDDSIVSKYSNLSIEEVSDLRQSITLSGT